MAVPEVSSSHYDARARGNDGERENGRFRHDSLEDVPSAVNTDVAGGLDGNEVRSYARQKATRRRFYDIALLSVSGTRQAAVGQPLTSGGPPTATPFGSPAILVARNVIFLSCLRLEYYTVVSIDVEWWRGRRFPPIPCAG